MAGIKISALPAITTPAYTDLYATVQAGVTYNVTGTQLSTLFLPLTGGTMTGALILNTNSPSTALEAASKGYVDSVAQGLTIQGACRLGSTAALTVTYANGVAGVGATLTNAAAFTALSLDGVLTVVGNRVLIKNQASSLQNGIYTVTNVGSGATNWVLTRATDYDQPSEINPGDLVVITAGSTLTNSSWIETATVATVGVDAITFTQFSASLPVNVASGGTGNTTFTAYSVITAGTTATGPFQNVVGVGTTGQVLTSAGAGALPAWSAAPLKSVKVQSFTTPGADTYTPSTGMAMCIIELQAGGGGSGGTTGAAGQSATSGAGGSGGYMRIYATAAQIGASAALVIGGGGAGGAAGNNNGVDGTTSSITISASVWSTGVGKGGNSQTCSAAAKVGGTGGGVSANTVGANATLMVSIQSGAGGTGFSDGVTGILGFGPAGGQSVLSTQTPTVPPTGASGGTSYGAGAGGAFNTSGADGAGAAGGQGIIIITEFCTT